MTAPTLPSEILTSAFLLTATLATGEGITECGLELCGYRAKCDMSTSKCGCMSNTSELTHLEGSYPPINYCREMCRPGRNTCPDNTTCGFYAVNKYRCHCSAGSSLSSAGQCLKKVTSSSMALKPTAFVTSKSIQSAQEKVTQNVDTSTIPITAITVDSIQDGTRGTTPLSEKPDPQTLTIGLAAGIGGVVSLAVVVVIIVFLTRRKRKRRNETDTASSRPTPPDHAHQRVVDPPMYNLSATNNPAYSVIAMQTELPVMKPPPPSPDNNATGNRDRNPANDIYNLYSNHTIPFNREQQRKTSGLKQADVDYSTTYSEVDTRGGNPQPPGTNPRGDLEYDALKLQRI